MVLCLFNPTDISYTYQNTYAHDTSLEISITYINSAKDVHMTHARHTYSSTRRINKHTFVLTLSTSTYTYTYFNINAHTQNPMHTQNSQTQDTLTIYLQPHQYN